jgi:hypothetical protein
MRCAPVPTNYGVTVYGMIQLMHRNTLSSGLSSTIRFIWLDLYLSGSREGFAPPAPFIAGSLPEKPYTTHRSLIFLGLQ